MAQTKPCVQKVWFEIVDSSKMKILSWITSHCFLHEISSCIWEKIKGFSVELLENVITHVWTESHIFHSSLKQLFSHLMQIWQLPSVLDTLLFYLTNFHTKWFSSKWEIGFKLLYLDANWSRIIYGITVWQQNQTSVHFFNFKGTLRE